MTLSPDRPRLDVDPGAPHRVLSCSLNASGLIVAWHVVRREVRDDDLAPDLDAQRRRAAVPAARATAPEVT